MLRSLNGKTPETWMDSGSNPGGVEFCGCEVQILTRIITAEDWRVITL